MIKSLILFDIDGTILKLKKYKSRDVFSQTFRDLFNIEIAIDDFPDFSGITDLSVIHYISQKSKYSFELMIEKIDLIWEKLFDGLHRLNTAENIHLFDGVTDLIDLLDKDFDYQLGLLTGNFKLNAYSKLRTFDLHKYFPFGSFGCDNISRNYLPKLAIQRANEFVRSDVFNSNNTLIIGDSPKDIECAKTNSIKSLAVATGNFSFEELKFHQPDLIFENFTNFEFVKNNIDELFH
jgi:phosphoglycolate phosphatase